MSALEDWGREQPLFNLNAAERQLNMERASLREKLSRMAKRGDVKRVERGKYTFHDDPWIYATHLETPSYISLWSGLRFYDFTTQQPTAVQVITPVNRPDLEQVEFHQSNNMFGFKKQRYNGFDIFVGEKERVLLDCLSRRATPVSELAELVAAVDMEKTVAYAERLGRNTVKKRVGYLLEQVRGKTVEALQIDDRNYPVLDLTKRRTGEKNSDWRITVNADVE